MTPAQLWDRVKHHRFWCETCHGWHPLHQHATCRHQATRALANAAREAITRKDPP